MQLLVIRHGLAGQREDWERKGRSDALRPLTPGGRKRMRRVAAGLVRLVEKLDLLASSPLVRARQTAEIVKDAFGGPAIDERCARRYDWDLIQAFYDKGHSVRERIAQFGFSSASWFDAVKRGAVVARPSGMPIEELLAAGTYRGRYHLKARLISEGLKQDRCERCGISEWQGRPITLALHHVNGLRDDNQLENLQILCPNCHSQSDTFAGRNGRARGREVPSPRPLGTGD